MINCRMYSFINEYSYRDMPLGLAYLCASFDDNWEVDICDVAVGDDIMNYDIAGYNMACVSVMSSDYYVSIEIIDFIRKKNNDILIVVGGIHPTLYPLDFLGTSSVDVVVVGEGESILKNLLLYCLYGNPCLSDIMGIYFMEGEAVKYNPPLLCENIDAIPLPEYKYFDKRKYDKGKLLMMASRGCPYYCKYCTTNKIWGKNRRHSVARVLIEIRRAIMDYNVKDIFFVDDVFTYNSDWVYSLCDGISYENLIIRWGANARLDCIDVRMINVMRAAGCSALSFGFDSVVSSLYVDGKYVKDEYVDMFVACKVVGIRTKLSIIIGVPGNVCDVDVIVDNIKFLDPDEVSVHYFYPLPGSIYWEDSERYGLILDKRVALANLSFNRYPFDNGVNYKYLPKNDLIKMSESIVCMLESEGYKSEKDLNNISGSNKIIKHNSSGSRGALIR